MNIPRPDIRRQVMAQIITVMADAEAEGMDPWKAAERAFPGTPRVILGEAYAEVMEDEAEAWWQQIERTIDGEIIRSAIVDAAGTPDPAGPREAELDAAFAALATGQGAPA